MTNFLSHFTLHLPWCPVKFQTLWQKIGEKNHCILVSLCWIISQKYFWLFSAISGRQLGHRSHTDSLSEQGSCQELRAGTLFGIGLLMLFEVVRFAFKCTHCGNPQKTPPHILATHTQTLKHFVVSRSREGRKIVRLHIKFFLLMASYLLCLSRPQGTENLECFIQSGSFRDP